MEYLATIKEEEKKEILLLKERIEALNELYLGFENLDLEDREALLVKMRKRVNETENSISQWWKSTREKYNIKNYEKAKCILEYQTNEIFLKD